jgi:hypothetical protein
MCALQQVFFIALRFLFTTMTTIVVVAAVIVVIIYIFSYLFIHGL